MSTPRAIGLVLMAVGICAYGTAPGWLALSVGLLGLAATLFADARYLRRAIARRDFRFLIDRAILVTGLALVAAIWLWRLSTSATESPVQLIATPEPCSVLKRAYLRRGQNLPTNLV